MTKLVKTSWVSLIGVVGILNLLFTIFHFRMLSLAQKNLDYYAPKLLERSDVSSEFTTAFQQLNETMKSYIQATSTASIATGVLLLLFFFSFLIDLFSNRKK